MIWTRYIGLEELPRRLGGRRPDLVFNALLQASQELRPPSHFILLYSAELVAIAIGLAGVAVMNWKGAIPAAISCLTRT